MLKLLAALAGLTSCQIGVIGVISVLSQAPSSREQVEHARIYVGHNLFCDMAISDKTRKVLWGRSGSLCAFCRCELFIDATAESEVSIVGEECHIVSGQLGGPRYDPDFPRHLIDDISNLLVLCNVHHKMVDDQFETYTAAVLGDLKSRHEQSVRRANVTAAEPIVDESQRRAEVSQGRTFVSQTAFFAAKASRVPNPLLDFSLSLHGRTDELQVLNSFLESETQWISILNGRGGVGKSKLLHDWSERITGWSIVFLKDAPLWHVDSAREIPPGNVVIVVDDAHRATALANVIQLVAELRSHQKLKLVLSTRPGGMLELKRQLYMSFDSTEVEQLPDIEELTDEQAEVLAAEVLGEQFAIYAKDLARVSGNSPLVIVAGGRLITSHHILPAEISGIEDFRNTVFSRFYDELKLSGPDFAINPPRPLLQVIAAIGPVNAASEEFLTEVELFLECTTNDILSTLDLLASHGVVTPRTEPVRIVPDVLSDYVLETACVSQQGLPTGYADKIFDAFGDQFFERLMQNLSELDWRLGRVGRGLDLLQSVWNKIYARFRVADTHRRRKLLEELRPAAVYQPGKILELVRLARTEPLVQADIPQRYWPRRDYILEAVPVLLEATAYHPDFTSQSVDVLWDLESEEESERNSDGSAKGTLNRLASYQRYKWAAFNFAMLLQAARLCRRPDAFDRKFTPLDLVDEILEREGEFTENLGHAISYGGFGLNPAAVAPVRANAVQFLDSLLYAGRDIVAIAAARSLGRLLFNTLNRMGRESSPEELAWQQQERLTVIPLLAQRLLVEPLTLPVRRCIIDVIRSASAVRCNEEIRDRAGAEFGTVQWDDDLLVFDAVCCREGDFPITSTTDPAGSWNSQSDAQLAQLAAALNRRFATVEERAAEIVTKMKLACEARLQPNGFERIVRLYWRDGAMLAALADCIGRDPESLKLVNELSFALRGLHSARPEEFRTRAREILSRGVEHQVIAAAGALRVDAQNVTAGDISLIETYLAFPNSLVRREGLHAIAYLGQKPEVQPQLLRAVLSVPVAGDAQVAATLVGAFSPYGVWLTQLSEADAAHLLNELATIQNLSVNQGAIPSFLSRLTERFPDQVLEFLLRRLEMEEQHRANGDWDFHGIDSAYGYVSFGSAQPAVKGRLAQICLDRYLRAIPPASSYRSLFWSVLGGFDDEVLSVLSRAAAGADEEHAEKILTLIRASAGRLVLGNTEFVKQFLRQLSGAVRAEAIAAFVENAYSLGSGGFAGDPNQRIEQNRRAIETVLPALQSDGDMDDLIAALNSSETPRYDFGGHFGLQLPPG